VPMTSISLDSLAEDVGILAVIVAELKFGNVQRHLFLAHFMECADHAALEDGPKAFDCVGVDRAYNVLALRMINHAVRKFPVQLTISNPLIRARRRSSALLHQIRTLPPAAAVRHSASHPIDDFATASD
jgi:hypothetical protein